MFVHFFVINIKRSYSELRQTLVTFKSSVVCCVIFLVINFINCEMIEERSCSWWNWIFWFWVERWGNYLLQLGIGNGNEKHVSPIFKSWLNFYILHEHLQETFKWMFKNFFISIKTVISILNVKTILQYDWLLKSINARYHNLCALNYKAMINGYEFVGKR